VLEFHLCLIYTAVLLKEDMSMSEIQGTCLKTPERTVIRAVKELVKKIKAIIFLKATRLPIQRK